MRWKPCGMLAVCAALSLAGCGRTGGERAASVAATPAVPPAPAVAAVRLTWLSVTGWLIEAGETSVVLDGYVSRVDRSTVHEDGTSSARARSDSLTVDRVRRQLLPGGGPDWVLVGHGHWDHALDAPLWARLGRGRMAGSATVCFQSRALGLPPADCTVLNGGETLPLGPGLSVRTVRWHHSGPGDAEAGRRLRAPLELRDVPRLGPEGGLRPGTLEDYPGGAPLAYLFRIETVDGPVRIFWSNSGNPEAWDRTLARDTAVFAGGPGIEHLRWNVASAPTRDRLASALEAGGGPGVDVWIGFGNPAHAAQVIPLLRPRAMIPHHWDDFWGPIESGPGRDFPVDGALARDLAAHGVELIVPEGYFRAVVVSPGAVRQG